MQKFTYYLGVVMNTILVATEDSSKTELNSFELHALIRNQLGFGSYTWAAGGEADKFHVAHNAKL